MGRPLKGNVAKKVCTVSVDPLAWESFCDLVRAKEPDGDTSASSHIETMVKREIIRLTGQDPGADAAVTVGHLQTRLATLERKRKENMDLILAGKKVQLRWNKLVETYDVENDEPIKGGEKLIRFILIDIDRQNSPVQTYFDGGGNLTELNLLIQFVRLKMELSKVNDALVDAQRKALGITTEEIAARKAAEQDSIKQVQTMLEQPEEENSGNQEEETEEEEPTHYPRDDDEEEEEDWEVVEGENEEAIW